MGRRMKRIPLLIAVLLLLVTAVYALIFALSNNDYTSPGSSGVLAQSPDASDDTYEPEAIVITALQLSASDIPRGSLVLVNAEHGFDVPDDHDFVSIASAKSESYMVVRNDLLLSASIMPALNAMMDEFYAETGISNVTVRSAFRSIEEQQQALDNRIAIQGYLEARRYAMLPGHSEHHTGLAVDFGVQNADSLSMFHGTGDLAWFSSNAHRFGFILRYTTALYDITGIADEPWHYRYVGVPHAYFIHRNGWALEEYIDFLMDFTPDEPFRDSYDGVEYEIFHTQELEVIIPPDTNYSISGNNVSGFIVTLW